jgi:cytoskeletal protein CcmA (bactofilin family)
MAQPFFGRRDSEATGIRPAHSSPAPAPAVPTALQASSAAATAPVCETVAKLTVGPNIKLKGVEITDCDTLLVEGSVEATMKSRVIQIAETGAFHGEAEIETAEIMGRFDGSLTVRDKLVIRASGRVSGKVRYGKLVIEEGGQLSGEVQVGTSPANAQALSRVA